MPKPALANGGGTDGAVHYYLAVNLGIAVREHPILAAGNIDRLETELKQAVALSPDIRGADAAGFRLALSFKAPAWPSGIGDRDKALELLEKAVKEYPEHPLNHLFYAQALWDESDKTTLPQVKAEFELGQKLLAEGDWGYNKAPWKKEFDEFQLECGELGPVQAVPEPAAQ